MAAVINTNYLSLVAQNNLNTSQSALGTAIQRLSSGLRINSAKDDAAGEAIANRFTANVNGLTQATQNANDGISIAQTTEGALDEVNDNLQRIRELAVQAANGTNSASDLTSIQDEITQRLDEINRVSAQTQFNGITVLAQNQSLSIQVGANDGQTIDINLQNMDTASLGLTGFSVGKTALPVGAALTSLPGATAGSSGVTISLANVAGTGAGQLNVDASTLSLHAINDAAGNPSGQYVVQSGNNFYAASVDSATGNVTLNTATVSYEDDANGVTAATTLTNQLVQVGVDASGSVVGFASVQGKNFELTAGAGVADTAALADSGGATATTDATSDTIQLSAQTAAGGLAATAQFTGASSVDPLAKLDSALAQVDSFRSELGAIQNRFDSAITNLNNTVNNLSSARSGIEDADFATEVSNMTRAQILQQAGTSVLAQANQVPQTVLTLLR